MWTTFRTRPLPIIKRNIFITVSTIWTRFRCGSPLIAFMELTIMFSTFQFHDLKELIESKVRYLASPEPFHTFNIQGFKEQCIVFPAQTCRKFPMSIKTLPGDLPILPAKDTQCFEPPIRQELSIIWRYPYIEMKSISIMRLKQDSMKSSPLCSVSLKWKASQLWD